MEKELLEAIERGIAAAPCPILTDEVIAAHRLPIPLNRMTAICKAAPKGALCQQRGEWLVVMLPKGGQS